MDIFEALAYPAKKTKEGAAALREQMGEENVDDLEWFPKGNMPTFLWAGGNVVGDLVVDPLNALPVGLLAKARHLLPNQKQLAGAVSSFGNYIPDWYGPGKDFTPNAFDEGVAKATGGDAGLIGGARKKVEGAVEWGWDNIKSAAKHLESVESRALWDEFGITTPQQARVVREGAKGTTDRGRSKAAATMLYNNHIIKQSGHQPEKTLDALVELANKSHVEDYFPATQQNMSEAFMRHSATDSDGVVHAVSKSEADYAAEKIAGRQQIVDSDSVVLKAPGNVDTGGHFSDLVHNSNLNDTLRRTFEQHADEFGNVPLHTLSEQLGKMGDEMAGWSKRKKKEKGVFWRTGREDPDGVWVEGSKVGSAITEGGVGWVGKVSPDGTMKIWMQDGHDFFEKFLKVANAPAKAVGGKGLLPDKVVAVTPPMVSNIKTLKHNKKQDKPLVGNVRDADENVIKNGRKNAKQELRGPESFTQVQNRANKDISYKDMFEDFANTKASPEMVAKHQKAQNYRRGGLLSLGVLETSDYANRNRGNEQRPRYEDRLHQEDYDFIQNKDGSRSTHRMAAEVDAEGNWFAFPEIQEVDGKLVELPKREAMARALSEGNYKAFGADKGSALKYAKGGYKKGTKINKKGPRRKQPQNK